MKASEDRLPECLEDPIEQYRRIRKGHYQNESEEFVIEAMKHFAREGLLQLSQNGIIQRLKKEVLAQKRDIRDSALRNALISLVALGIVEMINDSDESRKVLYSLSALTDAIRREW